MYLWELNINGLEMILFLFSLKDKNQSKAD